MKEKSIHQSEALYRSVYNTAPLAFVVWDQDTRITDWNQRAKEIFGWRRDEVLGQSFFDLIIPESARIQVEVIVAQLLQGKIQNHSINENITRDGEKIICEWNNAVLRDEANKVVGAISLGLDITAKKQAEQELQQLNEALEARVAERTQELALLVDAMTGREVRMAELKQVIEVLRAQLIKAGITPEADDPLADYM
jgi:PAS domain S-box-containing protein